MKPTDEKSGTKEYRCSSDFFKNDILDIISVDEYVDLMNMLYSDNDEEGPIEI